MRKYLLFAGLLLSVLACDVIEEITKDIETEEGENNNPEVEPEMERIDRIPDDTEYLTLDGTPPPERTSLNQGWDDGQRAAFWFMPQGARIMPYRWFAALEQPDNEKLFRNAQHMEMLGYLPMDSSKYNPGALPVGFAMSRAKSQKDAYMGFTCAACHVNQIDLKYSTTGKPSRLLIDGAPTLANFVTFLDRAVNALDKTATNDDAFQRFAERVVGKSAQPLELEELRNELDATRKHLRLREDINKWSDHLPDDFTSYGRLDAFTNIENAGSAQALHMAQNRNPADAPVSYPFLWGTHQSNVVQWNGSAPNIPRTIGPMVRNIGQVVGVFGQLSIDDVNGGIRYSSDVDIIGLGELEGLVKNLRSPRWDDPAAGLPELDPELLAAGQLLFAQNCAGCHTVIDPKDEYKDYEAVMTSVADLGTDPLTAWSAEHHMAATGILKGQKAEVVKGERFGDSTQAINIAVNGVAGIVKDHLEDVARGVAITTFMKPGIDYADDLEERHDNMDALLEARVAQHEFDKYETGGEGAFGLNLDGLAYKARPLNGIWATAPYLHNGSVPDLWSLLLPEEQRPERFWVGSRRFDDKRVGFESNRGKGLFTARERDGKLIPGNSNLGHLYGTELNEKEKWALIEYMKSL